MADGTVTFSTALDNSQLEKDLKQAERDVDGLKKKVEKAESKESAVKRQLDEARAAAEAADEQVERLRSRLAELSEAGPVKTREEFDAIRDEVESVSSQLDATVEKSIEQGEAVEKLKESWKEAAEAAAAQRAELEAAEGRVADLGAELRGAADESGPAWRRAAESIRERFASVAQSARSNMANAANGAAAPWERFGKRVNAMLRKVFVFGVILAGLRAVKSAISDMLAGNEQFHASVENLKATMGGFLSSVVGAVIPVLTQLVNMLAAVFGRVAGLIDSVFGTNITGAISQNRASAGAAIQAENAQKLADAEGAQAKSAKKLAKEQEKANRQLMSFDEINALAAEDADDAADGGGYSASGGVPELTTDWTQMGFGDLGVFQQVVDWLDMIRDRIENDVEGPFARIREGLELIKLGWNEVVEGVSSGDWKMAWKGVGDIAIGALYDIEGAFGALLDWLDEMTGGRFHDIFDSLKGIVHGFVEFVEGLLRGDLPMAFQGLMDMLDNLDRFLRSVVDGICGFLDDMVSGAFSFLKRTLAGAFDELARKYPQFEGLIRGVQTLVFTVLGAVQGAIQGAIATVQAVLGGAVSGAKQMIAGALDFIVGVFTLDGERVVRGLKSVFNGVMTIVEGAINGVLSGATAFLNGIIDAVNHVPGVKFGRATAPRVSLPRLAQGAVIPPNREFLAVLGDQKRGTNVEAPESLIRQIVSEESAKQMTALMQAMASMQGQGQQGDVNLVLRVGNEDIARATAKGQASLARRGLLDTQLSFT